MITYILQYMAVSLCPICNTDERRGRLQMVSTGTISATWIEKMENRTRIALYRSTKILHTLFFLRIAPLAFPYILQYIGSSYILRTWIEGGVKRACLYGKPYRFYDEKFCLYGKTNSFLVLIIFVLALFKF